MKENEAQELSALRGELAKVKSGMHTSEATKEIKNVVKDSEHEDPLIETSNNPYHQTEGRFSSMDISSIYTCSWGIKANLLRR